MDCDCLLSFIGKIVIWNCLLEKCNLFSTVSFICDGSYIKDCVVKRLHFVLDNRQHFLKYPNSFLNEITVVFLKCFLSGNNTTWLCDVWHMIAANSHKRRLFLAAIPTQVPRTGQTPAHTHTLWQRVMFYWWPRRERFCI